MAVAVRSPDGVTSGTISSATATWTLTKPTGAAQNDVLLAVLTTGSISLVSTPPTGWAQVWSQDQGTEQTQHVYRKVAGASEPASYDFGLNGSEIGPWAIVAVTGADTTTPINTSASGTTGASTSHTTPSITPTVDACLLVATYSNNAASTTVTYTAPAGMTEQFDLAEGTSFIALSGHTEVQATAAAVTKTATSSGSDSTACGLLAVAPGTTTTEVGRSFAVPYAVLAAPFVNDPFTDTAGVLLSAHTEPVAGALWTRHPAYLTDGLVISDANRVRADVGANMAYFAPGVPASADYDVQADLTAKSVTVGRIGIAGRCDTTANTMYFMRYDAQTNLRWELYRAQDNVLTLLGNFAQTLAVDATYTVKLEMRGSAIKLYVDGTVVITVNDTAPVTGAGRAAIRHSGNPSTSTTGLHVDNFVAVNAPGAVAGTTPVGRSFTALYQVTVASSTSPNPQPRVGSRAKRGVTQPAGFSPVVSRSFEVPYRVAGITGRSFIVPYSVLAASTTTRYVSPTGSNTNDGLTTSTPWATLQYAVQNAPAGATVFLLSGTYAQFTWTDYTLRTDYVTFKPNAGATITFNGFSMATTSARVNWVAFDGITFNGTAGAHIRATNARILNCNLPRHNIYVNDGSEGVLVQGNRLGLDGNDYTATFAILAGATATSPKVRNITVRDNLIDGVSYVGVNMRNFENCVIEDNEITNIVRPGTTHPDAIRTFAGGDGLIVRRNFIHDCTAQGIFFKDGAVSNVLLENNVVGPMNSSFVEVAIYATTNLQLINNTIVGACNFNDSLVNVTAYNNIISSWNQLAATTTSYNYKDYNLAAAGNITPGTNGTVGSPTYVDSVNDNYRLTTGSLGVNAGVASGGGFAAPSVDADGLPRPVGAYDIGAYERQS